LSLRWNGVFSTVSVLVSNQLYTRFDQSHQLDQIYIDDRGSMTLAVSSAVRTVHLYLAETRTHHHT
jgi:transcriptional regulator GlxA family with amidase domain